MRYILTCFVFIILFSACRDRAGGPEAASTGIVEIDVEQLPQRSSVNPKASEILKDWTAFQEMETSFDALYRVVN